VRRGRNGITGIIVGPTVNNDSRGKPHSGIPKFLLSTDISL
jgi:hypothetical protein